MKGCIESKCTVNTVVSELISLLGNTDYDELNFCNKKQDHLFFVLYIYFSNYL